MKILLIYVYTNSTQKEPEAQCSPYPGCYQPFYVEGKKSSHENIFINDITNRKIILIYYI